MSIILPALGVAIAAFCIWLTVRIINRRERWSEWTGGEVGVFFILIVASLAALSSMQRRRGRTLDELYATRLEIAVLTDALEMYALDHKGQFPSTTQGLEVLRVRSDADEAWKGPSLRDNTTLIDGWGMPLVYDGPPASGESIESRVWSTGPDKTPNTSDDVHR